MAGNVVNIEFVVHGERDAERAMDRLGASSGRTGTRFVEMGKDAGFLDKELDRLKKSHIELIKEFDKGTRVDILKDIRKNRRQIRIFEQLKKELMAGADSDTWSTTVGKPLVTGIGKALASAGPYVIAGVVALAAAALPFLGAAVSGTVLGAVGAGGIIGGLALAAQDSRVRDAFKNLLPEAKEAFGGLTVGLVAPALESIKILRAGIRDVADEVGNIVHPLAKLAPMFTKDVIGLIENTLSGIGKALEKSEPAIRALSHELPKIGTALGQFFEKLGDESDGAALGFIALSRLLRATIVGLGEFLAKLAEIYEWSIKVNAKFTGFFEDVVAWVPLLGDQVAAANDDAEALLGGLARAKDGSHDFSGSLKEMGSIAKNTAEEIDAVKTALDELFGKVMDSREATRAYEEAIDDLSDSVAENGRTLDVRIKQGRENQAALDREAQAIKGIRDANIANNMSVDDANAIYYRQLEALRKQAYQLGLNKQMVDAFIDSLKAIPAKAEVEVYAPGLLEAIARAKELARLLGSTSAAANAARGGDYVSGRAGGGPVIPGQTYVVGENGPEVLKMGANGGYVYSPGSGPSTAAVMSGASGGATQQWRFTWEPPASGSGALSAVAAALMPYLIKGFRVNGVPLSNLGAGA